MRPPANPHTAHSRATHLLADDAPAADAVHVEEVLAPQLHCAQPLAAAAAAGRAAASWPQRAVVVELAAADTAVSDLRV